MELRGLALVGMADDETSLSTHRLIQSEYRHYIGREEECRCWVETVAVLREAFPKQHKGFTMFNHWRLCETLIEHVEALAQRYQELRECTDLGYNEEFVYLLADASR